MKYNYLNLVILLFIVTLISCQIDEKSQSSRSETANTDEEKSIPDKEKRREELYQLMGRLPDRDRPISVEVISWEETDEMVVEKLLMDINGLELVPAYFSRPKNVTITTLST